MSGVLYYKTLITTKYYHDLESRLHPTWFNLPYPNSIYRELSKTSGGNFKTICRRPSSSSASWSFGVYKWDINSVARVACYGRSRRDPPRPFKGSIPIEVHLRTSVNVAANGRRAIALRFESFIAGAIELFHMTQMYMPQVRVNIRNIDGVQHIILLSTLNTRCN